MPRIPIDELDDPRIAVYRHLKATNETRHGETFIVEGSKLVERLRDSRYPMVSALIDDRREVEGLPPDLPVYVVPRDRIDLLVGFNFHQGVLACGLRSASPTLDQVIERIGRFATVVVCPTLNNPENLGAIIRNADVFGADAVLVGPSCPDPLSRRVLRVSMGTALRVPVIVSRTLELDLFWLAKLRGFERWATVAEADAERIESVAPPERLAVLFGSEPHGLDRRWVGRCDRRVTIPMRPGAESLNVAVAAGIILHRCQRPT